jgi:hypothetical protein
VTPTTLRIPCWGLVASAALLSVPAAGRPAGPDPEVPAELLEADWKLGPFYVKPEFAVRDLGWDSNVYLEPDERSDFTATIAPAVRLALPFGDNVFSFRQEVAYVYFQDFEADRGWDWSSVVGLDLLLGSVRLDLREVLRRTREHYGVEVVTRPRRVENRFLATLGTDRDAGLYLEGSLRYDLIRFDSGQSFEGESLPDRLDHDEVAAGLAGFLELGPARLLGGGEVRRDRFRLEPESNDSDGYFVFGGLRLGPDSTWRGDARVGYQVLDPRRPDHPEFSGLGVDVALTGEVGEAAVVAVEAERGPRYSTFEDNLFFVLTGFRAGLTLPVADRLALELGSALAESSYPLASAPEGGSKRDDRQWSLVAATVFKLSREVGLRLGLEYRERSSNLDGYDYQGLALTSGVRYGP